VIEPLHGANAPTSQLTVNTLKSWLVHLYRAALALSLIRT
jgi:hypothetical protein